MTATGTRRRRRPAVVLSKSNRWRIIDGEHYRDCLVELPDGTVRTMGVLDSLLAGAA